ncbi:uncharacterized protein LOC123869921 [Maniola jurtina]|uniref:uncharacterized protein LOC123869921 n=1 Tax=Maniola jurtina TaxID=191418 RepID=UPI001E688F4D|nr:uncharacterized protein LOC123869921 [Maniola jurtina]XP_045768971.1 uncharacterized protein LOC123869921 [Maniola jurtina]
MMAQPQYSLSWEDHPKNICNGLSYLQQNGEFVDMTLAADGHLVKVHQVIMALSSPYLKDLIASAQCPHPVIVLNKISHTTLASILEYIYRGEVMVAIEDIRDLIDAAKELHIKGLQEMDLAVTKPANQQKTNEIIVSRDTGYLKMDDEDSYEIHKEITPSDNIYRHAPDDATMNEAGNVELLSRTSDSDSWCATRSDAATVALPPSFAEVSRATVLTNTSPDKSSTLQYTLSTHGSLQLILNRFLYYLKNTRANQNRQWRCVDYLKRNKCPAVVITKDNMVLQRIKAHMHPFHDDKIWKKIKSNNVFSEIVEAEQASVAHKTQGTDEELCDES